MICNKCGNQSSTNSKFCEKCGNQLEYNTNNQFNNQIPQNFNQNPMPQYTSVKKKNKWLIILFVILGLMVVLFIVSKIVIGVSLFNADKLKTEIEKEMENIRPNNIDDKTNESKPNIIEDNKTEGTKRVGNSTIGYVSVPNNWNKMVDVDLPEVFQYSSSDGYVFASMTYENSNGKSKGYANNLFKNMEASGATGVTGASVKIGNTDAYQVYGYYSDTKEWIVTWLFEPGDGITHYLSVEGKDRNSSHFNIPNTFSLNK